MSTGWYIDRFQPFEEIHQRKIDSILKVNDKCVVIIKQMAVDKDNPIPAQIVKSNIEQWLHEKGKHNVTVRMLPGDKDITIY